MDLISIKKQGILPARNDYGPALTVSCKNCKKPLPPIEGQLLSPSDYLKHNHLINCPNCGRRLSNEYNILFKSDLK